MFEFISDNPFIVLMVLYAIYRFFKPKKPATDDKAAKKTGFAAVDEAARRALARQGAQSQTSASTSLEDRIEALARAFEAKMGSAGGLASRGTLSQQPISSTREFLVHGAPVDETSGSTGTVDTRSIESGTFGRGMFGGSSIESGSIESESLESRSLESRSLESRSLESEDGPALVGGRTVAESRIDDSANSKAFEYHSAIEAPEAKTFHLERVVNPKAFEYRTAVDEPDAKKFHLDSFTGFHSATGVRVETASVETIGDEHAVFEGMLGSTEDIQRAFVLTEVLSRPLSLRGRATLRPR